MRPTDKPGKQYLHTMQSGKQIHFNTLCAVPDVTWLLFGKLYCGSLKCIATVQTRATTFEPNKCGELAGKITTTILAAATKLSKD